VRERQANKFATLLGLYVAQAIPMSFFSTAVPVIARQEGFSLETIGLLQLVKLPWILKFLWAPLVDRTSRSTGDYKRWIVASELFYAVAILATSFLDLHADFHGIVLLLFVALVASATQDIATDALAILTLRPDQRGKGNGVQSAGGFTGSLVGGGLLLLVYERAGWHPVLAGLSCLVLLALVPLGRFRYRPARPPGGEKVTWAEIPRFFKGNGAQVAFLLLCCPAVTGLLVMLKPFLVDLGHDAGEIGFMSGIAGTATAAACAAGAGLLVKPVGTRRCAAWFCAAMTLAPAYLYWLSLGNATTTRAYVATCLLWGAYGLGHLLACTSAMNRAREGREGTDFTLQIVLMQLGSLVTGAASGLVAGRWGYGALFLAGGAMTVATLLFVLLAYNKRSVP
jgi:predicted MFS family arabinose efflux permease